MPKLKMTVTPGAGPRLAFNAAALAQVLRGRRLAAEWNSKEGSPEELAKTLWQQAIGRARVAANTGEDAAEETAAEGGAEDAQDADAATEGKVTDFPDMRTRMRKAKITKVAFPAFLEAGNHFLAISVSKRPDVENDKTPVVLPLKIDTPPEEDNEDDGDNATAGANRRGNATRGRR
jgi:hypothetical protein